jgi:hypothetical protein
MRLYIWVGVLRLSKLKVVLNDGQGNRYLLMQGMWPCTQIQAHKHGHANMGTQSQAHKHGHAITGAQTWAHKCKCTGTSPNMLHLTVNTLI